MGIGGMIPSDSDRFDKYGQDAEAIEETRKQLRSKTIFNTPIYQLVADARAKARETMRRFRKVKYGTHHADWREGTEV